MLASGLASASWTNDIIYQVMPDRFYDGDPSNNQDVDRNDPRAWHGGDLKGLRQKLGYIRDLGATALWLTPVYEQVPGRHFGATGYHGYWPQDFRNVDPRFGTMDDFRALVKSATDMGLKVMIDQVVNHYGYNAAAVKQKPDWFHDPVTCASLGNKDENCPIFGLPDLAVEKPAVRSFLFENASFWRSTGVTGYRYDAIKHVPQSFLKELLARDARAGTFTLGEYYDADPDTIAQYQALGFDSLFNFALQAAMKRSVMAGSGLSDVRAVLERQGELRSPNKVALFLDNHDVPRFASGSPFEDIGRERTMYGIRALMTLQGIPVLWQGTEIAMRGGNDPDNRRDMRFPESWTPDERAVYEVTKRAIGTRRNSAALSGGQLTLVNSPAMPTTTCCCSRAK